MSTPFHAHLVAPSNEDSTYVKPLWVATLSAHTPDDVKLTFRDDGLDPIDLAHESDAPDLVGISVNSKTAARAYAIAAAYRARGSRVVLGGIHVTALPEEALEHADAVVSGEAEWIWQDSVSTYNGSKFRFRPVAEVIAELETCGPRILFGDDNVMIHTKYSHELFEAMVPLGKHWVGAASLAALHRVDNVDVMARSGCRALLIGFESVADDAVRTAGKKQNKPHKYREVVRSLSDHGIGVWGSFIFGLDDDSPDASSERSRFASRPRSRWRSSRCLRPTPARRCTSD